MSSDLPEEKLAQAYHQKLETILAEIVELKKTHKDSESQKLLSSLDSFIRNSAIFKILNGK